MQYDHHLHILDGLYSAVINETASFNSTIYVIRRKYSDLRQTKEAIIKSKNFPVMNQV